MEDLNLADPCFYSMVEKKIHQLAFRYARYLLPNALFTREDLIQEGWMVWIEVKRRRYYPECSRFLTLFHSALVKRYNSLLRYEARRCRCAKHRADFDELAHPSQGNCPEQDAMLAQALDAIARYSADLAQMIRDGCPQELLTEARIANRLRAVANHGRPIDGAINVTPTMIGRHLKINLKKVRRLANNFIDLEPKPNATRVAKLT